MRFLSIFRSSGCCLEVAAGVAVAVAAAARELLPHLLHLYNRLNHVACAQVCDCIVYLLQRIHFRYHLLQTEAAGLLQPQNPGYVICRVAAAAVRAGNALLKVQLERVYGHLLACLRNSHKNCAAFPAGKLISKLPYLPDASSVYNSVSA